MMSLMLFEVYGAGMFGPQADLIPKRELSSVEEGKNKMEKAKHGMKEAKHGMEEANRKLQSVKEEVKQVKSGCSACSCGK